MNPNASPIMNLAFTGAPLDQLYDIANNEIQPSLASVPGVGQVNLYGGLQREIRRTAFGNDFFGGLED